jgi:HK97 gp10 family phage protein
MAVTVKVEGLRELDKALSELPKATGKNTLRRAARTSLEPIVEAARGAVPVASGQLRDSMVVATKLSKRQAAVHRKLVRDTKSSIEMFAGAGSLPHAHLLEFGTARRHHKSGKFVGSISPRPFMRPAWDAGKEQVLETFKDELWKEISKAAARLARKAARLAAKG